MSKFFYAIPILVVALSLVGCPKSTDDLDDLFDMVDRAIERYQRIDRALNSNDEEVVEEAEADQEMLDLLVAYLEKEIENNTELTPEAKELLLQALRDRSKKDLKASEKANK